MGLHLQPVGPLPASTYWRRRALVVLLGLGLLVVGGTALGAGTGSRQDEPGAVDRVAPVAGGSPTGAATPTGPPVGAGLPPDAAGAPGAAAATPGPPPLADVPACRSEDLGLDVRTDRQRYAAGDGVGLRLTLRNSGPTCRLAPTPGVLRVRVVSGPDRWWSSEPCSPLRPPSQVLAAGEAVQVDSRWPGRRSSPGCGGRGERARPGVYRVVAELDDRQVRGSEFAVG